MSASNHTDFKLTQRLLREARPYWLHIVVIFAVDLLATPLALLTPVPLKIAVDNVLGSEPLPVWLVMLPADATSSAAALLAFTAISIVIIALLIQVQMLGKRFDRGHDEESKKAIDIIWSVYNVVAIPLHNFSCLVQFPEHRTTDKGINLMQPEQEGCDNAKVAPATAYGPE